MNNLGVFFMGYGIGSLLTYIFIMLYARSVEKNYKETLIKIAKEKWKKA